MKINLLQLLKNILFKFDSHQNFDDLIYLAKTNYDFGVIINNST